MSRKQRLVIGIDLGTTYSGAAVYSNGLPWMVPDKNGNVIIPSMVAFTDNGTLVGEEVRFQIVSNVENSIYDTKRFIGRNFKDRIIQSGLLVKRWPFSIVNESGRIKIEVTSRGGMKRRLLPEEISALILKKLKKTCEDKLGEEICDAVISVPAYFNENERNATRNAGTIAGLNVLRILNEPTAAALAYGFGQNQFKKNETILVYDLGGGTFDVSIVNFSDGNLLVRASKGDSNLGGQDFTNKLRNYCIEDFKGAHGNIDIAQNKMAFSRLTQACENAKRRLSGSKCKETKIKIDRFCRDQSNQHLKYSINITRSKFEEMNLDSFNYTMDLVQQCMQEAKLTSSDIDEVVLVGGSTRIPMVQQILESHFTPEKVNKTMNPDEAVAIGAAIQAAILAGETGPGLEKTVLFDNTPLSLGTDIKGDEMSVIIKRNSIIPIKKTDRYVTLNDNQTAVHCGVYQGERTNTIDNVFLGEFTLTGLRKASKGEVKVDVTFDLNTDGMLAVTAREVNPDGTVSSNVKNIIIENSIGRHTPEEIQQMIETSKQMAVEDSKFKKCQAKKIELDRYIYNLQKYLSLKSTKDKLVASAYKDCLAKCHAAMEFLETHKNGTADEYDDWLEDLEEICEPVVGKHFQADNGRRIGDSVPLVTSDIPHSERKQSKYELD